jgi:uncharacterized protein (DUF1697 family)
MTTVIGLLRGVNVGGHNKLEMKALRALCESLKLSNVQTYVQSGNVVFQARDKDLDALARGIEGAIEKSFGFRPSIVLRTLAEMRDAVERNPFAGREGIEPGKLLCVFLGGEPAGPLKPVTEEVHLSRRELYIYFPDGQGKSKLSFTPLGKIAWTGRNWNTVTKLLEMAASLET